MAHTITPGDTVRIVVNRDGIAIDDTFTVTRVNGDGTVTATAGHDVVTVAATDVHTA